jgi:hypothetical protein
MLFDAKELRILVRAQAVVYTLALAAWASTHLALEPASYHYAGLAPSDWATATVLVSLSVISLYVWIRGATDTVIRWLALSGYTLMIGAVLWAALRQL